MSTLYFVSDKATLLKIRNEVIALDLKDRVKIFDYILCLDLFNAKILSSKIKNIDELCIVELIDSLIEDEVILEA